MENSFYCFKLLLTFIRQTQLNMYSAIISINITRLTESNLSRACTLSYGHDLWLVHRHDRLVGLANKRSNILLVLIGLLQNNQLVQNAYFIFNKMIQEITKTQTIVGPSTSDDFFAMIPIQTWQFLIFVGIVFLILFILLLYLEKCLCFRTCQGYTCFDPKPVGKKFNFLQGS